MQNSDLKNQSFVLALPVFPGRCQPSIVSRNELNYRVRNGNGWTLTNKNTNYVNDRSQILLLNCLAVKPFFSSTGVPPPRWNGTPSGTRTLDTLIKSQVLYQLS